MSKMCPDCETELVPITLTDQLNGNVIKAGIEYTLDKKVKSRAFKGGLKNRAGVVHGYLCPNCSRVLLYATPDP